MSRPNVFETEYKEVVIEFHPKENKYKVDHMDLQGSYDSLEEAKKAIRTWLNPTPEAKKQATKVLVADLWHDHEYVEATTFFTEKSISYTSYKYFWVTYTDPRKYTKKEAVCEDKIILDTEENRLIIKAIKAKEQEFKKIRAAHEREVDLLKKKLTPAKPA